MQVSVIVCIAHIVLAGILEIVGAVGPGISNKRSLAGKVVHAAHGGLCAAILPGRVVAPVVVERIDVRPVNEIEFVGLKMVGRGQFHRFSVNGVKVFLQFGNPALAAAEGHPRLTAVIHHGAGVKDGAAVLDGFVAPVNEAGVQGRGPWAYRGFGLNHACSPAAVGKVEGEKRTAVGLGNTDDTGSPGRNDPWGNLPNRNQSVVCPVYHIIS